MSVTTAPALSSTTARMLDTLPIYYRSNPWVIRILQGWAAEIDRIDALLDNIKSGLVPTMAADDQLGMLSVWEQLLKLPVAPAGVTVARRQQTVRVALLKLSATTAQDVLALLAQQNTGFRIDRDTPGPLQDTLEIFADEGSYQAALIRQVCQSVWPAHRELVVGFTPGFILDRSQMDQTAM